MSRKSVRSAAVVTAIASLTIGVLAGCTSPSGQPATPDGYTIGFVSGANNEWGACLQNGVESAADELGVHLLVANSDGDAAKEIANLEDLISQGVDAIALNTVSVDALAGGIQKAQDAGIPLYLIAVVPEDLSPVLGASVVDLPGVGALAAGWIAEDAGGRPATVAIVAGAPGASSDYVVLGFRGALPESVEVVAEQPGFFNRGKAQEVAENLAQAYPDLDYVFVLNEDMAFGVRTALDAAGLTDTRIVTENGTEPGLAAITAGQFSATISDSAALLGASSIEKTVALLDGSTTEKVYPLPIALITKGNVGDAAPFCG